VLYMLDSCSWWTTGTVPPTAARVDYLPARQTGRLLTALVIDSSETGAPISVTSGVIAAPRHAQ
jgi:hypothetical protein